ncbi:MAG TPA: DUF4136 domain-containing protein [Myxococcales bacterium]|nr:DUF4136 domain-containing protein [Myxococcales bacterium]
MNIRRWFSLAAIAAAGCGGYGAPDEVAFGSVAVTQPAPGATFHGLQSYYLDPNVEVWLDGTQQPSIPVPSATATIIDQRMQGYGYTTKVTTNPPGNTPPAADVGLRLAYLKSTYAYYYSGGYCSIYWAYYACWPGWAYAGSYTTGTVLMAMIDTKNTPSKGMLWTAGLYAVLYGSSIEDTNRLNAALTRAFDQSTYLSTQ